MSAGAEHADVRVVDEHQDACAGVAASEADVVEPAVVQQGELAVGVELFRGGPEVAVDQCARTDTCATRATPAATSARRWTGPACPGSPRTRSARPWPPGSTTPDCPPARSPTTSATAGPASPRTSTSAAAQPAPAQPQRSAGPCSERPATT